MTMYRNSAFKGETGKEGNVAAYIESFRNMIAENDGTRSFSAITEDCHDNQAPFLENQETTVKMTCQNHDVTQIEDSFMTFEIELKLRLEGTNITATTYDDPKGLAQIFVGFKNSAEILHQLQVFNRGQNTGLQDNECLREAFAMQTIMPKIAKKKRYDHSLWENVEKMSPCVAGTYVTLHDLGQGPVTVTFEINVPFTDLLPLQAFTLWPNLALGDLELKFYIKKDGLVWAMCDPVEVLEKKRYFGELAGLSSTQLDNNRIGLTGVAPIIRHAFTQIGNSAEVLGMIQTSATGSIGALATGPEWLTLHCSSMRVTRLNSTVMGFGIRESSKERIRNFFRTPCYIPSQKLDFYAFPHAPNANGINTSINAPLVNCPFISFMFPKHANDRTVFDNIMYQNVQCTIMNKNYPDEPISTLGARFLQLQLVASELDGPIDATKEYETSLTEERNDMIDDAHKRRTNSSFDNTSFMVNIQLERSNAGYCFDGIDTGGQNVSIQLKGDPIIKGAEDTYFNFPIADGPTPGSHIIEHPVPPEAWICRECFWQLSLGEGMRWMEFGSPPGSQVQY
jgi:hypothetical protein